MELARIQPRTFPRRCKRIPPLIQVLDAILLSMEMRAYPVGHAKQGSFDRFHVKVPRTIVFLVTELVHCCIYRLVSTVLEKCFLIEITFQSILAPLPGCTARLAILVWADAVVPPELCKSVSRALL